jgi:hypothetical protein
MHRTARGKAGAAARDPAATVAPLRRLYDAGITATRMERHARAEELYARAVAAAEAALPAAADGGTTGASLIMSTLLRAQYIARTAAAAGNVEQDDATSARIRASLQGAESTALLVRARDIGRARWRAGTLFEPTPEETAFFQGRIAPHAHKIAGITVLLECAMMVFMLTHPASHNQDGRSAVLDALRAALEADARGLLGLQPPLQQQQQQQQRAAVTNQMNVDATVAARNSLQELLQYTLGEGGLLVALRALHGLSSADEAALRVLLRRVDASLNAHAGPDLSEYTAAMRQRAADDVARHGLRACALPECAATEPHPKAFKLCSRCKTVVYCCKEHQQVDWRRHKRDDGCKAAA